MRIPLIYWHSGKKLFLIIHIRTRTTLFLEFQKKKKKT